LFFRRHIPSFTILIIAIVTIWTSSNINWGKDRWTRIIKVDGNGYYAYLPAIFIYQDLHFGFFDEIAEQEGYQNMGYEYRYTYEGKVINKYFAGTALAQLPFFLAAHLTSFITGEPMDGYSVYYLVFINIASLFYLLISCLIINEILLFYRISPFNRAIVLIAIVFGTNLFYYSVYEPSMSHVYSMASISLFIYTILLHLKSLQKKYLFYSAVLLGIIVIIRPVNLIVIAAIPFLSGDWKTLRKGVMDILKNWKTAITVLLLFLLPILIQFTIYKIQTGSFWVYSYGEEKFYLGQPHLIKMLFSYRKGLFVYTPVLLFSLAGLIYLNEQNRWLSATWLLFFFLVTYLLSCWHQWYYGGSFGSRVFIEYYALFAIPLGILLQELKGKFMKSMLISILAILIFYSIIQTYQYYAGIIHWSDMDRELYWGVFLKFK
jgi:hypothetical protein